MLWSSILSFISLTMLHTCFSSGNVINDEVALRHLWVFSDDGSGLMPITRIRSDCNDGEIISMRISAAYQMSSGSSSYLAKGGSCSESKIDRLLTKLKEDIRECYDMNGECGEITLMNHYRSLVQSNCSLCNETGCTKTTPNTLRTQAIFTFEVVCKVVLRSAQLVTFKRLEDSPPTPFIGQDYPTDHCDGQLGIDNLIMSNTCPKSLRPSTSENNQRRRLISQLETCLKTPDCGSTPIQYSGVVCPNTGKREADHTIVIIWSCATTRLQTTAVPNEQLTARGRQYRVALIVVSLLLLIALLGLISLAAYIIKRRQFLLKACKCDRSKANINNNESNHTPQVNGNARTSETLQKYQKPLQHNLDEHRYTNLSLKKQSSDDVYEYVDPDETAPIRSCEVDYAGYLIPQP